MIDKKNIDSWPPEAEDDNIIIPERAEHMSVAELDAEIDDYFKQVEEEIASGKR